MKRLQIIRLIAAVLLLVLIMPAAQAGGAPPKITTTGLPRAVVGVPYSARISSVDDPSTPTAFNIYYNPGGKNDFPTTLTLTSKGVIQGTPNKAGTFTFSVQAANGWGEDYKVLTLRVIDVNDLREGGENTSIVGMDDDPLTGVANAVNGGMVVVHADIAYFLDAKGYLYQAPAATGKGTLAYKAREYAWLDSLGDTLYYYHRYLSERGKSNVSLTHKRPTGKTSDVYVTRIARDYICCYRINRGEMFLSSWTVFPTWGLLPRISCWGMRWAATQTSGCLRKRWPLFLGHRCCCTLFRAHCHA